MNSIRLNDGKAQKYASLLNYYQGIGDRNAQEKASIISGLFQAGASAATAYAGGGA